MGRQLPERSIIEEQPFDLSPDGGLARVLNYQLADLIKDAWVVLKEILFIISLSQVSEHFEAIGENFNLLICVNIAAPVYFEQVDDLNDKWNLAALS